MEEFGGVDFCTDAEGLAEVYAIRHDYCDAIFDALSPTQPGLVAGCYSPVDANPFISFQFALWLARLPEDAARKPRAATYALSLSLTNL